MELTDGGLRNFAALEVVGFTSGRAGKVSVSERLPEAGLKPLTAACNYTVKKFLEETRGRLFRGIAQ